MSITPEKMINVADMARLTIDDDLKTALADQLNNILNYVNTIEKAVTDGVNPTVHPIDLFNVFREDEVLERKGSGAEKTLENAPITEDRYFVVPRTIGQG